MPNKIEKLKVMSEENIEYIICAAIWFRAVGEFIHQPENIKDGFVITGRRHHNCFATLTAIVRYYASETTKGVADKVQGFLTNEDRFVDRKEAMTIAKASGQVTSMQSFEELFSEDLY